MTVRMPKLVGMLIRNKPRSSPPSRTLCSASSSERGKDRLHPCEKLGARLGRRNGARGSRKKPGSQVRLEIGDDAGGLRLRETTFARCSREAAESRNARVEPEGEYVLHCANR
jgi:hypothetical protein